MALATTTTDAGESSAYHPINTFLHFVAKEYFVNGGTWQIAAPSGTAFPIGFRPLLKSRVLKKLRME